MRAQVAARPVAIHPTALVDPAAAVHPTADVGPYCVIGAEVSIGAGARLMGHVWVEGPTAIGDENIFYPFCSIGCASQDLKYQGERTETRIGSRNKIREYVTVHRGTAAGGGVTSIGDDNLLMANVHVAHDCHIGSHTVLANAATLGGHVTVGDWARIGAYSGVHQFCRIGPHAMIGGYAVVTRDVLPFALVSEEREAKLYRANAVGLERRGFAPDATDRLNKALRLLRDSKLNTSQAVARIREEIPAAPEIEELLAFIESSDRGFIK
ncbi:MAG: acyl-ACP--UDP-N-acetylglucosamine O-acyltransferase [Bryobacteraceae bacterium]